MDIKNEKHDSLSVENGLDRERYIDLVTNSGGDLYSSEEEHAMVRKVVAALIADKLFLFPELADKPPYKEFLEYHKYFEDLKNKTRAHLGMPTEDPLNGI